MSGSVLIMTLFGGTGTLLGPFVGAGVFIWMRDFLSKHLEYWEVFVGGAFVLIVLFLPDGIVGTPDAGSSPGAGPRRSAAPRATRSPEPERLVQRASAGRAPDDGRLLESRGLTKTFGGLTAVNRVDFQVRAGELRSVIGPERRGQDHVLQPPHRRAAAVERAASCSRAGTSPACPRTRSRASASRAPTR